MKRCFLGLEQSLCQQLTRWLLALADLSDCGAKLFPGRRQVPILGARDVGLRV